MSGQTVDVAVELQRMLDLSQSTTDADTGVDATFVPVPIEEFVAAMRVCRAAVGELIREVDIIAAALVSGTLTADGMTKATAASRLRAALARVGGAA